MGETVYRDLAGVGLRLVTPGEPEFEGMVREIQGGPEPAGAAAVLLNECGCAVLGLSYIWKYHTAAGEARTSHCSNFSSSLQLEVLTGRSGVVRDVGTFILPGSKRLITERAMFGNNLDVLNVERPMGGGGGMRASSSGGGLRHGTEPEIVRTELIVDLAILEDGRCVGPDEKGLFQDLLESLQRIQTTAQQAASAMRDGASAGQIFEMLRPLARGRMSRPPFLWMFADIGIRQLVESDEPDAARWFEGHAQPGLRLHRSS